MSCEKESGLGLPVILFFIFMVLKLTGYIDWSWWAVTSPIWVVALIAMGVLLLCGVIALVCAIINCFLR